MFIIFENIEYFVRGTGKERQFGGKYKSEVHTHKVSECVNCSISLWMVNSNWLSWTEQWWTVLYWAVAHCREQNSGGLFHTEQWRLWWTEQCWTISYWAVADCDGQNSGGLFYTEQWRTVVDRTVVDYFILSSGGLLWTEEWWTILYWAVADCCGQNSGGLFYTEQWRTVVDRRVVDYFMLSSGGLSWTTVVDYFVLSSGGLSWTEQWLTLLFWSVAACREHNSGGLFYTELWRTVVNTAVADPCKQWKQWSIVNRGVADHSKLISGGFVDTVVKFRVLHGQDFWWDEPLSASIIT
jgi:hypothetical protein